MTALAADLYATLTDLDRQLVDVATDAWWRMDPDHLTDSFFGDFAPEMVPVVAAAQVVAARTGAHFIGTTGVQAPAFAGYAPNGDSLVGAMLGSARAAMAWMSAGVPARQSMSAGLSVLDRDLTTLVHDTGRQAEHVAIVAEPRWIGYERIVEPGACARCILLSGRIYRWSSGFKRHPRCRCGMRQVERESAEVSSPKAIFELMSEAEQDRIFTRAGAEAIRDGADISQVVNARKGMTTLVEDGRKIAITTEGTSRRGWYSYVRRGLDQQRGVSTAETSRAVGRRGAVANYTERRIKRPRLLPEEIYRQADGNRATAMRLLMENGYYVGPRVPIAAN